MLEEFDVAFNPAIERSRIETLITGDLTCDSEAILDDRSLVAAFWGLLCDVSTLMAISASSTGRT